MPLSKHGPGSWPSRLTDPQEAQPSARRWPLTVRRLALCSWAPWLLLLLSYLCY